VSVTYSLLKAFRARLLRRSASVGCTSLSLLLCGAAPAFAQTTSLPHGSLFSHDSTPARQKLDLSFTLGEAYDSDTPEALRGIGTTETLFNGYSTIFAGGGEYRLDKPRVQLAARAASEFRYVNELDELRAVSTSGAIGVDGRLGPRTSLLLNQSVAYSPSYFYGLFPSDPAHYPGEPIPPAPNYAVSSSASYSYATSVALTHSLSRRNQVSAAGDLQYTDFVKETNAQPDVATRSVSGDFSRNLTRNAALRMGYRYRQGTFSAFPVGDVSVLEDVVYSEHMVDGGVGYSRPLSATRRFEFTARLGASAIRVPPFLVLAPSDSDRLYRATSDMSLKYQFKTVVVGGYYRRGLDYVPQLRRPVFTDGVSANLTALLTDRLDLSANAAYTSGSSTVFLADTSNLETYTADVRFRYALTRGVAAYAEYLYYFYDLGSFVQLGAGVPHRLERNGVRAGLMLWLPVFRR